MNTEIFFPLGIATGDAFCNRVREKDILKNKIFANDHTVLISPRRYGKTSLITQVLQENNMPHCLIDLLLATDAKFVKAAILEGAGSILATILPKPKQIKNKILNLITTLHPQITINALGQSITLSTPESAKTSIIETLLGLDKVAKTLKKRVVVVLDEFQQIAKLEDQHTLEATIRHAVERSHNVTYLFSGSNRTLLAEMFSERTRPLYHLCSLMHLERIAATEYIKFIQAAALTRWQQPIASTAIQEVLTLTACHPYHVNLVCKRLWEQNDVPNLNMVREIWADYMKEQRAFIINELGHLTVNQRKILIALARNPTHELQGKEFCTSAGVTPASVKKATDFLRKNDYIYYDEAKIHHVLNPIILAYLKQMQTTVLEE